MAFKFKTAETKIILLNLLKCVLIFYLVYYIVLCFCFTAFRIQMLDGFAPFDFKTKPSWFNPHYLVLIISMEIACVISGLLFALLVEEWVWDYAITITIIHITVTSAGHCTPEQLDTRIYYYYSSRLSYYQSPYLLMTIA
ncbi:transmembrane protein 244 isoform X2 [Crotalus tigris]|uniref:transmembrane protein 244 isoform X2 n=1 Tax=Crotalus tigris TaxID=88082 RepID=UPI00192F4643|nr:transmembrane protein 244 isoform X2 [Crotalus tigris]